MNQTNQIWDESHQTFEERRFGNLNNFITTQIVIVL